mmetsp:Transcript_3472/g.5416  ORF Transcript_3472/g.5416 Transcript_3472/m.5416 type:complete len:153 (+) Transcript_3472:1636-2094(+)
MFGLRADTSVDHWFIASSLSNFEREELNIFLYSGVGILATNKTLYIEYSIRWVACGLVLCCITNDSLTITIPGDVRWCNSIAHIVRAYLNPSILPHSHTAIGGTEINSNTWSFNTSTIGGTGIPSSTPQDSVHSRGHGRCLAQPSAISGQTR